MRKSRSKTGGTRHWRSWHPLYEDEASVWFWCLHCEHVWDGGSLDWIHWKYCLTVECDGSAVDLQAWETSQAKRGNPEYPDVPIVSGYYPLWEVEKGRKVGEVAERRGVWRQFPPAARPKKSASAPGASADASSRESRSRKA